MSGCLSPFPLPIVFVNILRQRNEANESPKNFLVGSPKTRVLYRCLCVQVCESIKIPLEKELEISQSNGANGADSNSNVDATRCAATTQVAAYS